MLAAGRGHTVGLKADGTVVATGLNNYGQCDVAAWKDVVAISAGSWHTVGLLSDGTLVATGNSEAGQCDIRDWRLFGSINTLDQERVMFKDKGDCVM